MVFVIAALLAASVGAKPAFSGPDFSGVYDCTGNDDHEGQYTGTVTLELVSAQSFGAYGAYNFKLDVFTTCETASGKNPIKAALAVAMANELGRWEPDQDLAIWLKFECAHQARGPFVSHDGIERGVQAPIRMEPYE